ncbi:hypothetical protein [Streptomyces sp. NPDC003077]
MFYGRRARQVASDFGPGTDGDILTFFADGGGLYGTTLLKWGESDD